MQPNKAGFYVAIMCLTTSIFCDADDRQYQHGIDFISLQNGSYWLIWASAPGDPPQNESHSLLINGEECRYFTHDVYYSHINTKHPSLDKKPLIILPEAQEPISAAISTDQHILLTMEDGSDSNITSECNGVIQQRYQIFDNTLKPKSELKTVVINNAHSGHAAAVGKQFVIIYVKERTNTDPIYNKESGSEVFLEVIDTQGKPNYHRKVTDDNNIPTDWWPLIAGSANHVLLVWQRYVNNDRRVSLMYAVYNPATDQFIKPSTLLETDVYNYHYDVQYLPSIDRFIIVGNHLGVMSVSPQGKAATVKRQKGFAYLLDNDGHIVAQWNTVLKCKICNSYRTHTFVREAQPAIYANEQEVKVLYPTKPKGALLFSVDPTSINALRFFDDDYYWHSIGTDGIFLDATTAFFATLSPLGLQTRTFNLK